MLVTVSCSDEGLAALGLVDALDQAQLLEFFEGAINADQSQAGTILARRVIHFDRGEGVRTPCQRLDYGPAWRGKTATTFLQYVDPISISHKHFISYRLLKTFFNCSCPLRVCQDEIMVVVSFGPDNKLVADYFFNLSCNLFLRCSSSSTQ
jgi:hypothetical protein